MRTTISLDDDVLAAVEKLRAERRLGLSEAVNELARAGLTASAATGEPDYVLRSAPLGLKVDVSNIGDVLDLMQHEATDADVG